MRPFTDLPPLAADDDGFARVRELVGPACSARAQLWVMFVDGDGCQSPVLMPIDGLAPEPDPRFLHGLGQVLRGLRCTLATAAGPGSVILTVERPGPDEVLASDVSWSDALRTACRAVDVAVRGVFLSTRDTVRRL